MPTYLRRFYYSKLVEQLEREQKEIEKATKKQSPSISKPNFNPKFKR
tara:strand:- start:164 stop:304 length:141 start_codon:yes stop_codon:yes gene_type:complete